MAQAVHAAFEFAVEHPTAVRQWFTDSNYLVIVAVPDEPTLWALAEKAHEQFIIREVVFEPDFDDQATAVAFMPGTASRRLCANFPLALRGLAMA